METIAALLHRRAVPVLRAALPALVVLVTAGTASAQVTISAAFSPPPIPVYDQPPTPGDGYQWTPGYWAWDVAAGDYYWVPGTWVEPPKMGLLWTPPWWGWSNGLYVFHEGYWGPHVGFYGGIPYGFGYFGSGYVGGRWIEGGFAYNQAVTNVNVSEVHNVYREDVTRNITNNRVGYNGGPAGVDVQAGKEDEIAAREEHVAALPRQVEQERDARAVSALHASANDGVPPIAATPRPNEFRGRGVEPAKASGGPYSPGAVHPSELPALQRYGQQHEEKLFERQERERRELQREQVREHERALERHASQKQRAEMEQRHRRDTQHMAVRHIEEHSAMRREARR